MSPRRRRKKSPERTASTTATQSRTLEPSTAPGSDQLIQVTWHVAAILLLALGTVANMQAWFTKDFMPPGDFAGYAAVVEQIRDFLLRHGRVPAWCGECFGGSTYFSSSFKEYLAFPLASWLEPVLATKLTFLTMKLLSALGMYFLCCRLWHAPVAGVLAGYAYGFGTMSNYEIDHLDVHVSAALFPVIFLAALETLRHRSAWWAALLGVLTACQLANNWVQAVFCPVIALLLLSFRPWATTATADNPLVDRPLARRWAKLAGIAFLVFILFGGSQLAWMTSDAKNHSLLPAEAVEQQRPLLIERSPFLFLNRSNWLAPWLRDHQPPGIDVTVADGERRYLGFVAIAACVAGWFAVRERRPTRRWYQVGLLLWLAQYWLALGPRTLLWQVARSFHWTEATEAAARVLLTIAAVGCLVWAIHQRQRRPAAAPGISQFDLDLPIGLALLLSFPIWSLWDALRGIVPPFEVQRSPGHFFDVGHFSFYLLMGVSVAALLRARTPPVRHFGAAALGVFLVVDFWPSTTAYGRGTPMRSLREGRSLVQRVPGENGTLRLTPLPVFSPEESWVSISAEAGHAWSWLGWQGGAHWEHYMKAAAWRFDDGTKSEAPSVREALLAIGRLKYFLVDAEDSQSHRALPSPWRLLQATKRFALWEQPNVGPMALAFDAYALSLGEPDSDALDAIPALLERHAVLIAVDGPLGAAPVDLVEQAAAVRAGPDAVTGERASRAVAMRHAARVVVSPEADRERWQTLLNAVAATAPVEVAYDRPAPERIVLTLDPAGAPRIVFVSEGYHPWWRATVDGVLGRVVRAQVAFMAVPVGAGARRIELWLEPPVVVAVADRITMLSWIALAVVGPGVAISRRRRKLRTD